MWAHLKRRATAKTPSLNLDAVKARYALGMHWSVENDAFNYDDLLKGFNTPWHPSSDHLSMVHVPVSDAIMAIIESIIQQLVLVH